MSMDSYNAMLNTLRAISEDDELLEVARKAIEDSLVAMRDSRIALVGRGNGLVIREKDGKDSHIIRMTSYDAVRVGVQAIADHLEASNDD